MLVDLEPGRPAQVRELPIDAGRRLLDVRGTLDELEQYRDSADDAFVRVFLVCERPLPGLGRPGAGDPPERARGQARVRARGGRRPARRPEGARRRASSSQRYHRDRYGAEAEAELLDLFDRLLDEATTA